MQVVDISKDLSDASFGEWVRELRKAEGWTQEELANKMGIASGYLSRVETGDRPPTESFCIAFSAAFGFPIYTVLVRAGLVEDSAEFAAANDALKKINEKEDPDVWEFKRLVAKIKDKEERERALDHIWSILNTAAKRSARRAAESEGEADHSASQKGGGVAAVESDTARARASSR